MCPPARFSIRSPLKAGGPGSASTTPEADSSPSTERPLNWFEIAGADRTFVKAFAEIQGGAVVVWNPRVARPEAVRFAWNQLAVANLANAEGLPASPFRTDRW